MPAVLGESIMVVKVNKPVIPPLENGDRLNRDEFERRYNAMPKNTKAELIKGVVYMASPVRAEYHGDPHADLLGWFSLYRTFTPGVRTSISSTIRFDDENEPQPDGLLMIDPAKGGQAETDEFGYFTKAPELLGEISASTTSYDLHDKLEIYRKFNVREYIVWRVLDEAIDWFVLRDDVFEPIPADADGIRKSLVFPGLWLDTTALLRGDLATVFSMVQRGLATPEHAEFVKRLNG
jgi:Uma2 family endonuclease